MLNNQFLKAKPIFPKEYLHEMNISLFYVCDVELKEDSILKITGNNDYRVFDNGEFLAVGPARAAHDYYRLDLLNLAKGKHHIVVELCSYNCNSYYYPLSEPFLQAEVVSGDKIISFTGDFNWKCYLNSTKIQKVVRFSYQRTFSESYVFDRNLVDFYKGKFNPFKELKCKVLDDKNYLERYVKYPTYKHLNFKKCEEGIFNYDASRKAYDDRYMHLEFLKIFPISEWETDPNEYVSKLEYQVQKINELKANCFHTYRLENSKTGFIDLDIECLEDSEIFVIFDEVDMERTPGLIDITFSRNTTHNCISYVLKKGKYHHISMEPYTIKFLRFIVKSGAVKINNIDLILFENPDIKLMNFNFKDEKVQAIAEAALSTFGQNAVDILTDCPSRERAGWLLDSMFTSKAENLITSKNIVEHNFLENYALIHDYNSIPEGMIPMCYPADFGDGTFIPNWSLFYIVELEENFDRTHDIDLLEKSKKNVLGLLKYFKGLENEFGLLEDLKSWIMIEWSKANDEDYVRGVNFPSNMLYCGALRAAGHILNDDKLIQKADKLKQTIREFSFNGKFFEDNVVRDENNKLIKLGHTTETCQYYAFYFNVATKEEDPELYNLMVKEFGPYRDDEKVYPTVYKSNVIMGDYFRLFILLRDHLIQNAHNESIEYFYKMAKATGTLWEHDSPHDSLNHGLTSCILNIITEIYFGVYDINHATKEIKVNDNFYKDEAEITIKTPDGIIKFVNDSTSVMIEKPETYKIVRE